MARILIFYQYFSTPDGTWSVRFYELGRRWERSGHHITLVTSVYDRSDLRPERLIERSRIEGMEVITINVRLSNKHRLVGRLISFMLYAVVAAWYALTLRADWVIASSGPLTVALPALVARWLRGTPMIFEVRDLLPEAAVAMGLLKNHLAIGMARLIERWAYHSATTVVALSPAMQPWIRQVCPGARIVEVPNGCDLDLFSPDTAIPLSIRQQTTGRFVALYTGTLGAANAGEELVDLAAELHRRSADNVLMVVIGDGTEKDRLMQRARSLALANIVFFDPMPRRTIAAWHAVAAVIVIGLKPYPILRTASPNKLFDALAAGRPVLNNTPGWFADLLRQHGCGLNHPPGDVTLAATHLLRLRDDAGLRKAMGRRGRHLAEAEFARDRLAARYAELFTPR